MSDPVHILADVLKAISDYVGSPRVPEPETYVFAREVADLFPEQIEALRARGAVVEIVEPPRLGRRVMTPAQREVFERILANAEPVALHLPPRTDP